MMWKAPLHTRISGTSKVNGPLHPKTSSKPDNCTKDKKIKSCGYSHAKSIRFYSNARGHFSKNSNLVPQLLYGTGFGVKEEITKFKRVLIFCEYR